MQCTECDWTGPFDIDGMRAVLCRQCGAELDPDALARTENWEALAGDATGGTAPARHFKRARRLASTALGRDRRDDTRHARDDQAKHGRPGQEHHPSRNADADRERDDPAAAAAEPAEPVGDMAGQEQARNNAGR